MRIESSAVAMQSERSYSAYAEHTAATLVTTSDKAAILDFSSESKSLMEQLEENKKKLQQQQKDQEDANMAKSFKNMIANSKSSGINMDAARGFESFELQALKKMLELLNNMRGKKINKKLPEFNNKIGQAISPQTFSLNSGGGVTRAGSGTTWQRITVESSFIAEQENTAFQAQGIAMTKDGKQISFGVTVEMSRAFAARYEKLSVEDYVVTDPLVINIDSATASVSDQKFMFDLNCDGKKEEMSFAGNGSGFLALDRNNDGKINDGSELFGTKSGDGFKDLAQFDDDKDGWIDEDDEVFNQLKIWTKDADGNDKLLSLKEADVGAIYLGKADTKFSLNDEANKTNAVIRSTGVYLKESGGTGTVQHVDLVI